jgi:hypothetical protein
MPGFTITVVGSNRAPVIMGSPATTAQAGRPYVFQPYATDADGQALRYSISNKPAWATFDPGTGALIGTPDEAHVGSYPGIVVSVTDGTATSSLPAFTLVVEAASGGWASLKWVAPTQNVDGTPLVNLAGYRIRYGLAENALTQSVEIPDPRVTSATLEKLGPGTWHFAVKAYTSANVESALSNIARKTIL